MSPPFPLPPVTLAPIAAPSTIRSDRPEIRISPAFPTAPGPTPVLIPVIILLDEFESRIPFSALRSMFPAFPVPAVEAVKREPLLILTCSPRKLMLPPLPLAVLSTKLTATLLSKSMMPRVLIVIFPAAPPPPPPPLRQKLMLLCYFLWLLSIRSQSRCSLNDVERCLHYPTEYRLGRHRQLR